LRDETIEVAAGDLLVHFTDGFNEAMRDGDGGEFGLAGMAEVVAERAPDGPRAVIDALERAVRAWAGTELPADDETLLVVGCGMEPADAGAPAPAPPPTAAHRAPAPPPVAAAAAVPARPGPHESPEAAGGTRGAAPPPPVPESNDPISLLALARHHGCRLTLRAELEQLAGIRAWIESCPD